MATRKDLDNYYFSIYQKTFPSTTLTRWVKNGQLSAIKKNNGRYDYDLENFKQLISSDIYTRQIEAKKQSPKDYIGRTKGSLFIKSIVPKDEYEIKYHGTLLYCDCLACGKKDIQVRFSYLSDRGNYNLLSCGCGRKRRAFLASARKEIDEAFLLEFADFEKFLFIHKALTHSADGYYNSTCDINKYKKAVRYFYNNRQFNNVYSFWNNTNYKGKTFYDLSKPSLDHIIPLSKGGSSEICNLQFLTVFENLSKRDMTWEEWQKFKRETNSTSDYFIESIMKGGDANE